MSDFWRDDISLEHEPSKVMILRDQLIDMARDNRPVKIKVYYPVGRDDGPFPVIVWSHGLGGSVDGAAFLARFLCSHGYIVVNVQHHGTDSTLWEGKEGHPWDIIRDTHITRDVTLNRFNDIPFLLEKLPDWMAAHSEVQADLSTMGMSGHSFGALTTQVVAGMTFPNEKEELTSFKSEAFKAGILYSPGSVEHLGDFDPKDVYPSIDIPLFHMTGTDDGSPISERDYTMRLAVYEHSDTPDKYLLVLKDGDHMVFNGSRGKLGQNRNREKHEGIIQIAALAYWDVMLKNDPAAREWLTAGGFTGWLGGEGSFQSS